MCVYRCVYTKLRGQSSLGASASCVTLSWPLGLFLSTSPVTFSSLSVATSLGPGRGAHCPGSLDPNACGQAHSFLSHPACSQASSRDAPLEASCHMSVTLTRHAPSSCGGLCSEHCPLSLSAPRQD